MDQIFFISYSGHSWARKGDTNKLKYARMKNKQKSRNKNIKHANEEKKGKKEKERKIKK